MNTQVVPWRAFVVLLCCVTVAAFTTHKTNRIQPGKWGVSKSDGNSDSRLLQKEKDKDHPVDEDFDQVDLLQIFGLKNLKKKVRKHKREHNASQRTPETRPSTSSTATRQVKSTKKDTTTLAVGKALKIIIAGAPASGKGTQCEKIRSNYGVVHLSTGDMLRAAVAEQTDIGKVAQEYMDSGQLVPDDVIIDVVKNRLEQEDCKENGWLLDGFPRTPAQAEALKDAGVCADCFVFLKVPDEILVERVVGRRTDPVTGKIYHMKFSPPADDDVKARLQQRSDDTEEKIKVRLAQFHSNVEAVKGNYSDIRIDVDGTGNPDDVAAVIESAILSKVAA